MAEKTTDSARIKLIKALELLKQELATIRTGRATPSFIENLEVEAYGSRMRLIELATIHAPEPHILIVSPFDLTNIESIVKAISSSNMGLNPVPEENLIRINVPSLTEERRMELVKLMHAKIEGGKIMVRQIRRDLLDEIEKNSPNDDEKKRLEKELQQLVDEISGEIDLLGTQKEKELMTV